MAQPTPTGVIDPRKIITPESFHVAPHLLGLPLASPSRRLVAILIDLVLVSILANVGGKVLFALAIGASFFWFAGRKLGKGGNFFSRSARAAFRGLGGLFVFIAAAALWGSAQKKVREAEGGGGDNGRAPQAASMAGGQRRLSGLTALRGLAEFAALSTARDSAHADTAARRLIRQMRGTGMTDAQIREALTDTGNDNAEGKPWMPGAVRSALAATLPRDPAARADDPAAHAPPDSLAALYVAAVHQRDSARAGALRPKLASVLARDSLDRLHEQVSGLENEKRELTRKVDQEEKKGLLGTLLGLLDDLGIGFGWTGLYFTAFTALWKGQTPGKKLLGIRVLRLDGLPMTLWASFERFGGYAAGLFTGLTGYMQVWWDRNRQAIQDKISETVVIRERGPIPVALTPTPAWTPRPAAGPGVSHLPPRPPAPPAGSGPLPPRG
jgi:uncharacterized RDD family membrane protein YckC